MLDSDTKRRIDSARQILVGKVPDPKGQVEQITTALIYKFMDDMDKEAEELGGEAKFFTGEYGKYAWSRLMDVRLGGQARLNLYTEALENLWQNKNLPPLFRQIFKGAFLPYRDPETLNLFLKEINGFVYDHSERLGDAYEYLLNVLGTQGDAGQFRTPRHIIDCIVEAVNPTKDDTILDPACGTAGFLISAYKHILKNNQKERPGDALTHAERTALMNHFTGYDISPDMVRLSLVNLYLHGFPLPNIMEYDTLGQEERWDESFNVILANPPFMTPKGGVMPHKRFSVQAKRSEVLFTDYIADHLTPSGRAGVIVPEGIIFQSGKAYKQLRKMLVEGYLYAVVSLPAGVFNPYAGVKTSVLLMDKNIAKRSREIAFVKVSNDGFDLGATRRPIAQNDLPQALEILKLWKEGKKTESPLAVYVEKARIAESGDFNLSEDRYRAVTDYSHANWPIVELGQVCTLQRGLTYSSKEIGDDESGIPFYNLKSIKRGGTEQRNDFKYFTGEIRDKHMVVAGDLLIALTDLTPTSELIGSPKLVTDNIKAAYSADLAKLSIHNSNVHITYLYYLLRSSNYRKYIATFSHGANVKHLQTEGFLKFQIPLPPIEVQQQIVEELDGYQKIISGARQVVENWKPRIEVEEGWERVKLDRVTELVSGQHIESEKYSDTGGGMPYITGPSDFRDINPVITKWTESPKILSYKNDILVTIKGSGIGSLNILGIEKACISRQIMAIRPSGVNGLFLYYILKGKYEYFQKKGAGAAIPGLTRQDFLDLEIPLPPLKIQKQIVEKVEAERALVEAAKKLIGMYEEKMKERVGRVWGSISSTIEK